MRFRILALVLAGSLSLQAEEIPLTDSTVVLGQRVGPIEKGMTLTGLKTLVGPDKFKVEEVPGPEGQTIPGTTLFKGTDREILLIFNPDGDEREIVEVRLEGKGWKFSDGAAVAKGMSVEEVQKANTKPYKVAGFGWDYGGYCDFSGGRLEGKVSVRFSPGVEQFDESLTGEVSIASDDDKLKTVKAKVTEVSIVFPVAAPDTEQPDAEPSDAAPEPDKESAEKAGTEKPATEKTGQ